jgi:hypothetical protein
MATAKQCLEKALEIHGLPLEQVPEILNRLGIVPDGVNGEGSVVPGESIESVVSKIKTNYANVWGAEVDVHFQNSLINTTIQVDKVSDKSHSIYTNQPSPAINTSSASGEPKAPRAARAASAPRETGPTISLPVAVDLSIQGATEFMAKCNEMEAGGIDPCYSNWETHAGMKKGKVDSLISKSTGLTASQFVRNKVWKAENQKQPESAQPTA